MQGICEPPLRDWPGLIAGFRSTLGSRRSFGGRDPESPVTIATGHQAGFWHPGILAKYFAAKATTRGVLRDPIRLEHVVVDQDVNDALTLHWPIVEGDALTSAMLRLWVQHPALAMGSHPTASARGIVQRIDAFEERYRDRLAASIDPLRNAWLAVGECDDEPAGKDSRPPSLAMQVTRVLQHMLRSGLYGEPITLQPRMASELLNTPAGDHWLAKVLDDPLACVHAYNRAARAFPEAGVPPLHVGKEHVELPLWRMPWGKPRQRVYALLDDPGKLVAGQEVLDLSILLKRSSESGVDGETGAGKRSLASAFAPRALLLTALMRDVYCDLFIHGRGGGVYDRITEQWFREWAGIALAPMAVVSADVTLPLELPTATPAELERAQWYAHHLPFNLDRELSLTGDTVDRKRALLSHMDDDRDKQRRSEAFRELHRINDALRIEHREAIGRAEAEVTRCEVGVQNAALLAKRDWPFLCYPKETLNALRDELAATANTGDDQ